MLDAAAILALLVALSAKVLVLVVLGAAVAWALRGASASCRHVLWSAVLGGVLVLAFTAPLRPVWSLPVGLPAAMLPEDLVRAPVAGPLARAAAPTAPRSTAHAEESLAEERWRDALPRGVVFLWLVGAAVFALRLVVGRIGLLRARLAGRPIESGRARALLDELGARHVRLIETRAATVPATWGVFRPVIALHAGAELRTDELEAVLVHELAHVKRRDALTRLLADLCRALLWFHPAVWFARRRMHAECERACDDAVLAAGTAEVAYAETLLGLASDAPRRPREAIAMADARDLEARLRAILDPSVPRSSSRSFLAAGLVPALLATSAMAGLDPWGTRLHADPGGVHPTAALDPYFDERIPFTREQEHAVLQRSFQPRDAREEHAFARLREAAAHRKLHELDLVRERALWALSIARPERVIEPLITALADPDWRARAYAAWCLELVGAPEAREALTARLDDPVWRVRANATSALAELADPRSLEVMLRRLDDPAWQVRMPVVEYLGRIGTPAALAAVRERLDDPHAAVRTAAEDALGSSAIR